MKYKTFNQFQVQFPKSEGIEHFLNDWKKIYEKSKSHDKSYRINNIVNCPINSKDISSLDIVYNEDNTMDMIINYKNGNQTKFINLEILDTTHIHSQDCNCENEDLDPTKLTFTLNYENIL